MAERANEYHNNIFDIIMNTLFRALGGLFPDLVV